MNFQAFIEEVSTKPHGWESLSGIKRARETLEKIEKDIESKMPPGASRFMSQGASKLAQERKRWTPEKTYPVPGQEDGEVTRNQEVENLKLKIADTKLKISHLMKHSYDDIKAKYGSFRYGMLPEGYMEMKLFKQKLSELEMRRNAAKAAYEKVKEDSRSVDFKELSKYSGHRGWQLPVENKFNFLVNQNGGLLQPEAALANLQEVNNHIRGLCEFKPINMEAFHAKLHPLLDSLTECFIALRTMEWATEAGHFEN